MKKIFRIARIELNVLFYSPIAWLMITIFLITTAIPFLDTFERWLRPMRINFYTMNPQWSLTDLIFDLRSTIYNAYLFIPLVTMGLISREVSSGTIRLLYSSPLKIKDIIVGKFTAMMAFNAILMVTLGVYLGIGSIVFASPDYGLIFGRLFGFYLLLCTYSAIGLFMSTLTNYQVVAAICSISTFALLNFVGTIGQDIEWARDFIYFCDVRDHLENINHGLINTKDIGYFLLIILLFLFFSFLKLQAGRSSISVFANATRYLSVIALSFLFGYILSIPQLIGYWDVTAQHTQTLTKTTQDLMGRMKDAPLEINSFVNILDESYERCMPQQREEDVKRWAPYVRFRPDIKFTYTYYYDSVYNNPGFYKAYPNKTLKEIAIELTKARKQDFANIKSPDEIHKMADLHAEQGRYCAQVKYKSNFWYLRIYDDNDIYPLEPQLATAFKYLLSDHNKPVFHFLTGEYERNIYKQSASAYSGMKSITNRYSLVNNGFTLDTINLNKAAIPTGTTCLVIADPRSDFSIDKRRIIQNYIDNGGNLLILGEIKKQNITNPLIKQFGVQINQGILLQDYKKNPRVNTDYPPSVISGYMTPMAVSLHTMLRDHLLDSSVIAMVGVSALTYHDGGPFKIHPIVTTNRQWAWQRNTMPVLDSALIKYRPGDGDRKDAYPTILSLSRNVKGHEQRIIIASDADWLSNSNNGGIWPPPANSALSLAVFSWLSNGQFPPDVSRIPKRDQDIFYLQVADMLILRIVFIGVLPAIILLVSAVFLLRRKRL